MAKRLLWNAISLAIYLLAVSDILSLAHAREGLVVFNGPAVYGKVILDQPTPDGAVHVVGQIQGLTPGDHGFHVHQFGNVSGEQCSGVGPHFNPRNFSHAAPEDFQRHNGDLGIIQANEEGIASIDIFDHVITLYGVHSILGRALVVHAKADDLGRGNDAESKKTGNAGLKLGSGIIGLLLEN